MLRVDPEKVEAQLAAMLANLEPYTKGSEPNNVLARMQSQVVPALIRWKTSEMNRASSEDAVLNAFVGLLSSQLVSVVMEVVGSPPPAVDDRHFSLINSMLNAIGEEVGKILCGDREMHSHTVASEEIGAA